MHFPVYIHIGGLRLHPHPVMEAIGYFSGFQLYLHLRRRNRFPAAAMPLEQNLWLIVACVFGALVGSKLLAWAESAPTYWAHRGSPLIWLEGKTIVGGLLGGWAGVEIAKRKFHIRHSTGDAFVYPLMLGMVLGRIGCFLTGLDDHTCGLPTQVPWAVNFGDGVPRHPTQLYDILFLGMLACVFIVVHRQERANGWLFLSFMLAYLSYRLCIEFLKPRVTLVGPLSAIQLASAAAAFVCLWRLRPLPGTRAPVGALRSAG